MLVGKKWINFKKILQKVWRLEMVLSGECLNIYVLQNFPAFKTSAFKLDVHLHNIFRMPHQMPIAVD